MKFLISLVIWIIMISLSSLYKEGYNHIAMISNHLISHLFFIMIIILFLISIILGKFGKEKMESIIDDFISTALYIMLSLLSIMVVMYFGGINPPIHQELLKEMPCVGAVGDNVGNTPMTGLKPWSEKCTIVVHFAHGRTSDETHEVLIDGELIDSLSVSATYKEKEQYWVSCRKDPKTNISILSFSQMNTSAPESIEIEGGKKIKYYARKGSILLVNSLNPWVKWTY